MSKYSQTWCTFSNGVIMHLDQMAQVGEQVNLIKVPQNHSCPEPNLDNSTLETFSFWSQLLWAWSHDQMRPPHQVVHQGEVIWSTRSTQVHFCQFLGFTKVALATLPKWAQNGWTALIICAIAPCGASWQMEIIFLPKPTSNTFWQNLKIHVLTPSTNLQEFSFLPQPLLVPLYLWCASLPERQ